jgi:hypothetical protein
VIFKCHSRQVDNLLVIYKQDLMNFFLYRGILCQSLLDERYDRFGVSLLTFKQRSASLSEL